MKLIVARHAETNWHTDPVTGGKTRLGITDAGKKQAEELGKSLGGIDVIYRSDTQRTLQTAMAIRSTLPTIKTPSSEIPIIVDDRLREVDEQEPDRQIKERVKDFLTDAYAKTPDGTVLAVTHGWFTNALKVVLGGENIVITDSKMIIPTATSITYEIGKSKIDAI